MKKTRKKSIPSLKLILLLALFTIFFAQIYRLKSGDSYSARLKVPQTTRENSRDKKLVSQVNDNQTNLLPELNKNEILTYQPGVILVKVKKPTDLDVIISAGKKLAKDLTATPLFTTRGLSEKRLQNMKKRGLDRIYILHSARIRQQVDGTRQKLSGFKKANNILTNATIASPANTYKTRENTRLFVLDNVPFKMNDQEGIMDLLTLKLFERLRGLKNIEYATLDKLHDLTADSNDPYFSKMWGLYNNDGNGQAVTYPSRDINGDGDFDDDKESLQGLVDVDIKARQAWEKDKSQGGKDIVVAVIDTGVDINHEDLQGNIWQNPQEIANGQDDDGNGLVDDVYGYNFSDSNTNVSDYVGHGTHVSGTIAATGNAVGVIGVAPQAKIMVLRVFPNAYDSTIAVAISYAVAEGASVMNLSLGRYGESPVMQEAIDYATDLNVAAVVAAGNNFMESRYFTPANIKNSITVGAIESKNNITYFSNYGMELDVMAPGQDILSLRAINTDMYGMYGQPGHIYQEKYYTSNGTSMAAPHVAGMVALIMANHRDFSVAQVSQVLRVSAVDLSKVYQSTKGFDAKTTYGRANLEQALSITSMPEARIDSPVNYSELTEMVPVYGRAFSDSIQKWEVAYKSVANTEDEWKVIELLKSDQTKSVDGGLGNLNTVGLPEGEHYLQLRVTDQAGNTAVDTILITVNNVYFTQPDPALFDIYGREDVIFSGVIKGVKNTGDGTYELAYQKQSCDINNESCWVFLNSGPIKNGSYEGVFGVFPYSDNDFFKGGYRVRLLASSPSPTHIGYDVSKEYFEFMVDHDLKNGWPVEITRPLKLDWGYWSNHLPPTVTDIDGDGYKEIATVSINENQIDQTTLNGNIHIYNYQGKPMAGWPITYALNPVVDAFDPGEYIYIVPSQAPAFYDLNNDGKKEIFLTAGYVEYIELAEGNYTFQVRQVVLGYDMAGKMLSGFPLQLFDDRLYHTSSLIGSLVIDDLNNDGVIDFIIDSESHFGAVDAKGNFLPGWPKYDLGQEYWTSIYLDFPQVAPTVGDINGDGYKDVLAAIRNSNWDPNSNQSYDAWPELHAISGQNGTALWEKIIFDINDYIHHAPALVDLDHDQTKEILIGTHRGEMHVFDASSGQEKSGWPKTLSGRYLENWKQEFSRIWATPTAGNLDDDPEWEVVINNYVGLQVFDHDGTFKWRRDFYFDDPTTPHDSALSNESPVITNLDGDSYADILVGDTWNLYAFDRNGQEIKGWPWRLAMPLNGDFYSKWWSHTFFPQATDIDRDGKIEIIASVGHLEDGPKGKDRILVFETEIPVVAGLEYWPMLHHDVQHTSEAVLPFPMVEKIIDKIQNKKQDIKDKVKQLKQK